MADIIQIRRDTAANWGTADPVLAQGELGWEIDTNVLKIGDGSALYSALPAAFADAPVDSVFGRIGAVVAQAGDYTGAQVSYSNATSGLAATTMQAAVDEVEGRVDALESAPGAPVDSVFGRTGAVVAQAGDYDADQVDFDDSNVSVTAPDTQSAIQQLYDRVGVFEAFNTDTATNLNTGGLTQVPIFGTTTQAGPTGYFTVAGNTLTVNVAMRVKVSANVSITGTVTRANIAIGSSLNGTIQGATGRSGYIRNGNGHNESSVHMSTIIDCAIGDQLGLFSQQQAAAGTVTMIAARSNYIVEILEIL